MVGHNLCVDICADISYESRCNYEINMKHTEGNRQRDRKKYVMISGGFVIPTVQNNSLNDST